MNKKAKLTIYGILFLFLIIFISVLVGGDTSKINEKLEPTITRTATTDTSCLNGQCTLTSYFGAVNIEYDNEFIPFENYLNVSEDNGRIKFETLDRKICYIIPEYEEKNSLTKSSSTEINIVKNRGNYYFTTDSKTEVNSMAYKMDCLGFNTKFEDNKFYMDDIFIDFDMAKDVQNISTTYNSKTNILIFTPDKDEFGNDKIANLSMIDPIIKYNYNATFEGITMWAFACDGDSALPSSPSGLLPKCTDSVTDITTEAGLNSDDSIFVLAGGTYLGWHIFYSNLSSIINQNNIQNDIISLNWIYNGKGRGSSSYGFKLYIYNNSNVWYFCNDDGGSIEPTKNCSFTEDTEIYINSSGFSNFLAFAFDTSGDRQIGTDYVSLEIEYASLNSPPTITNTLANNSNFTTVSQIGLTYNISDDNDYVLNSSLYLDGVLNQTVYYPELDTTLNFTFEGIADGTHTYYITTTDSDNEQTNSATQTFTLDATPPISTPTMTSPPGGTSYTNNTWTKDNTQITISASDTGVGYDALSFPVYCTDTDNTCEPTTFISSGTTISAENETYVRYYSNDTLGNKEDTQFVLVKIDKTSPTIALHYPTNNLNLSYNESIPLNFTIEDSYSGVGYCLYSLDGGTTNTSISCSSNTTINATEGVKTLTFFTNDSVNNWNTSQVEFTIDLTNPLISYGDGVKNNSFFNQNFINTNVSVTETNEKNITFDLYFSNYTLANSSTYTDSRRIINWTNLLEGVYLYNVTIFDEVSHSNTTETYTFTLDNTLPSIEYNADSDSNQTFRNSGWIYINVTASDTNKDSVQFDFDGTNETFDNNDGNYYWENKTGLSEGNYSFFAWINDSAGNYNVTENYTIIIDLTNPTVNILKPDAGTYNYNTFIPLNFSISDTNLNTCWYNLDNTANTTIDCSVNTTFNTTEATHTLYLFANDSSGRESIDTVTFTVSLAPPGITLDYPTDGMWWNTNNIYFNYTPSDGALETCKIWTNTTGTWHLNYTESSPTTDVLNNLSITSPDGYHMWNVWCNDSGGNEAWADIVSNHTFYVDSTYPLIDFGTGVQNNTNSTRTFLSTNVSVTETNEKNITFDLYFSNYTLANSSTYTDSRRIINWTNLIDNLYYFNVTIFDYSNNQNNTETYLIRLDNTPPTTTIDSPLAQNYGNNNSMTLNYTTSDNLIGMDTCWYYIYFTNGTLAKGTEILTSCVNDTFTLPGGDNNYTLTLFSKDLLSNTRVSTVTFGIRTESPSIALYPTTNTYSPTSLNHYFNFTVSTNADNISSCELWTNTTGTWHLNQTKTTIFHNGTMNIFDTIIVPESVSIWNVWCNDSFNYSGWALNNNNFIVDLTYPQLEINTINTPNSQTFSFNTSISDTNLDTCKYSILNSTGMVNGLNSNVSFTCNTLTSATTTQYGTFTLLTFARDRATNENSTQRNFTLTAPSPTEGGGGGGSIINLELSKNFTITSTNLLSIIDISLAKDSIKPRKKDFMIINKGISPIVVSVYCNQEETNQSTKNISVCNYVSIYETNFTVSPNEQERLTSSFELITPPNSSIGDEYYFNIVAKSTEGGVTKYSKLSVSSKVTFFGLLTKWSYVPTFGQSVVGEGIKLKSSYPVWGVSLFLSFIISITTFLIFRKSKMYAVGILLGGGIFILSFFVFLFFL